MEAITMDNQQDLPTNSTEEVDQQDQDAAGSSGGRSYKCVFCKHGLTSAQALGGHMNIHRKDRAKNRPNDSSNNNSSKQEDNTNFYAYPKFYHHPVITSFPNHQEGNFTYFSSKPSIVEPTNHGNDHQDVHGAIGGPSRDQEKMMSLSKQFGLSGEDNKESQRRIRSGSKEDELDLELRLGHDP